MNKYTSERRCYLTEEKELERFCKRVYDMKSEELSITEISRVLGVGRQTVYARIRQYNRIISKNQSNGQVNDQEMV